MRVGRTILTFRLARGDVAVHNRANRAIRVRIEREDGSLLAERFHAEPESRFELAARYQQGDVVRITVWDVSPLLHVPLNVHSLTVQI
ncbi:hypothetical protein FJZ36_15790 [Candidatus Poribacteria bacterium]|nr:hypothetical protein [Candidatus Poribacteria bacterium]